MIKLVEYKNDINLVPMRNFNPIEIDLFFTILGQMKDKGENEVTFTFDELKKISNYNNTKGVERFVKDLESTYDKLISLNIKVGTKEDWTKFVLFTEYRINSDEKFITVATNKNFLHFINDLTNNFTKLELEELVSLSSSYSKTAYRQLKQFRKTGYVIFEIDKFRKLFCVPNSYRMTDIDRQIFEPIENELSKYFKNLKINKISKGKGRKITHIEFTFDAEDDVVDGKKVFRDSETKKYYTKDIAEFTEDEIERTYPNQPEPMFEGYTDEELMDKKKYIQFLIVTAEDKEEKNKILKSNKKIIEYLCSKGIADIGDFI